VLSTAAYRRSDESHLEHLCRRRDVRRYRRAIERHGIQGAYIHSPTAPPYIDTTYVDQWLRQTRAPRHRRRLPRLLRRGTALVVASFLLLTGYFATLNARAPESTAFMRDSLIQPVDHQWVDIDHISRYLIAGVMIHEDDMFGERRAPFDYRQFWLRTRVELHNRSLGCGPEDDHAYYWSLPSLEHAKEQRMCVVDPHGSTIPVQLVKNLYLSSQGGAARKAVEAVISHPFDLAVTDRRQLELYLNYAQFAPGLYGICAAHWYYFGQAPHTSDPYKAGMLAGMLPLPSLVERAPGGGAVLTYDESSRVFRSLQWGGIDRVVPRLNQEGWQPLLAQVGITDSAEEHWADRGAADACGTMPEQVRQRLIEEGHLVG